MKKTYVKPEVYFENFELSTNIAAGCGASYNHSNTNFGNGNQCYLIYGTDRVFLSAAAGCTLTDFDDNQFCYHVSAANDKVFSS